jgi:DNA-binding FadR family transcriptional regulator
LARHDDPVSVTKEPPVGSPRRDLHESVLQVLGQAIVAGDISPGSVLRGEELEARFDVSRSVIREAVRVLESLSLVASRRRVGVSVLPPQSWDPYARRVIRWRLASPQRVEVLQSLNELRAAIEPAAARLAARRASPRQCGMLTEAVIEMTVAARSGDLETYLQHDIRFHRTLLGASGNPMFSWLATVVEEVLAGRTHHNLMPAKPEPEAVRLHGTVAAAVRTGDPDEAEQALRGIVAEAADALAAQAQPHPADG